MYICTYRKIDRLIWTVQDISEDFSVWIINETGIADAFSIKINHHNETEIMKNIKKIHSDKNREEISFDFRAEILPYQGFEIMWNLEKAPFDVSKN